MNGSTVVHFFYLFRCSKFRRAAPSYLSFWSCRVDCNFENNDQSFTAHTDHCHRKAKWTNSLSFIWIQVITSQLAKCKHFVHILAFTFVHRMRLNVRWSWCEAALPDECTELPRVMEQHALLLWPLLYSNQGNFDLVNDWGEKRPDLHLLDGVDYHSMFLLVDAKNNLVIQTIKFQIKLVAFKNPHETHK